MKIKLILIGLLLFIVGCDGYLGVKGRAYEWLDAKPEDISFILVDKFDDVIPAHLKPLKDIEIIIEPWTADKKPENNKISELLTQKIKTNMNGYFEIGITSEPNKYNATMSVRDPQFKIVERIFYHDRFHHSAIIILVRREKT